MKQQHSGVPSKFYRKSRFKTKYRTLKLNGKEVKFKYEGHGVEKCLGCSCDCDRNYRTYIVFNIFDE